MTCAHCDVAFCWLCFQTCGKDAHPHCREEHGGYFPPRPTIDKWLRRLRWRRVNGLLDRTFGARHEQKLEALEMCQPVLSDIETRLWPFPESEPAVGGLIAVTLHVHAAQFGQYEQLVELLDDAPYLLDQVDDRGMSALAAAAHGGHREIVKMLLERGADVGLRDDRNVSALDYALREEHGGVIEAILSHAHATGAHALDALWQRDNRRG